MKLDFCHRTTLLYLLILLSARFSWSQTSTGKNPLRNDHIFPAAAVAKPFIDFDSKGFLINRKRTFIVSAGMEYARVPAALWKDRLLKLKRAGFNAVQVYTFWNYHEPLEGKFRFSGDQDLDAFLKLVKAMGMYAIVRVGPYYCGEWNFGGYPIWLRFKPGLRVRENEPQFIKAVDRFFDRLIPIVESNQINKGGSVIMVQLENEHQAGWGNLIPNAYFQHLIDKTQSLGIQVPYYFSGLHPGNDPAGNVISLDDPERPNPWFSAEYWSVWFLNYGPQPKDAGVYDRRTWKIIAHGGNGYNVYMAHGGSNFEYNNDRDMAASYDYGAAVGQGGDLRPVYYSFKRAAWFARTFQEILGNSMDATPIYKSLVTDSAVTVTARQSPAGNLIFLDNAGSTSAKIKLKAPGGSNLPDEDSLLVLPGEIRPVVQNFSLTPSIKIKWASARINNIVTQAKTITLLISGVSGSSTRLYLDITKDVNIESGISNFRKLSTSVLQFNASIPEKNASEYSFKSGDQRIRILVMNDSLAHRSWYVENNIIIGPEYVADLKTDRTGSTVITEKSWKSTVVEDVWLYKPEGKPQRLTNSVKSTASKKEISLTSWQVKDASEPIQPNFNDQKWISGSEPLQMGADGDITADAWYRTKIKVAESGKYTIQFTNVRDRAKLFLDGRRVDTGEVFQKNIELDLIANQTHVITVFTAHDGRNKQIFYVGKIDSIDAKGLSGRVTLTKNTGPGKENLITEWKMRGGPGNPFAENGWETLKAEKTGRPQFYRAQFNYMPSLQTNIPVWRVITTSLGQGSVWINGHNLGRYPEKIRINGMHIPEVWLKTGMNKLVIYDEDGVNPEQVSIQAEEAASRAVNYFTEVN